MKVADSYGLSAISGQPSARQLSLKSTWDPRSSLRSRKLDARSACRRWSFVGLGCRRSAFSSSAAAIRGQGLKRWEAWVLGVLALRGVLCTLSSPLEAIEIWLILAGVDLWGSSPSDNRSLQGLGVRTSQVFRTVGRHCAEESFHRPQEHASEAGIKPSPSRKATRTRSGEMATYSAPTLPKRLSSSAGNANSPQQHL